MEHDLSVGGAFITTVHLKRNFCESSIHKESSAVDREMADESFNSKLKIDQSKWIAQVGISDVPVYFNDYGNASNDPYVVTGQNMGGHRLTSSEIFDYLKTIVEHNDLMGKSYSTDNKNPYVCTTFVDEVLSLINASKSDYLPGGQKVVNSIEKLNDLTESNGKNPKEGTYIFYYDYGDGTGHTGFVKFDSKRNAEILHNGSDGKGN